MMKKCGLLFLILLMLLSQAACRDKIRTLDAAVQVLSHQVPVTGAVVTLDNGVSKATDAQGTARFPDLAEGHYLLTVKRDGFQDYAEIIFFSTDSPQVKIDLENRIEPPAWVKIVISANSLTVQWAKVANPNLSKYRLYRSTDGVTFDLLSEPGPAVTQYVDKNVTNGHMYYYQLESLDSFQTVSPPSQVEYAIPYSPLTYQLLYSKMNYLYHTFDLYLFADAVETNLTISIPNETICDYNSGRKELLYISDESGSEQLYSVPLSGGERQQLTYLTGGVGQASFAPDGSEIIYQNRDDGKLYRITAAGTQAVPLAVGKEPDWGSAGLIVFVAPDEAGVDNLFTMQQDGSALTQLTFHQTPVKSPSWSPDGAKIAYVRSGQVCTINADGSGEYFLTNLVCDFVDCPAWSPDGAMILFSANAEDIPAIYVKSVAGAGSDNGTRIIGYGFKPVTF